MSHTRSGSHLLFVDSSALFAAASPCDASHVATIELFRQLASEGRRFITTNFVVAELHALVLNRVSRELALRVLHQIDTSKLTVTERIQRYDEERARAILEQYDDKSFSLTDAASFAVMERLEIRQALTLDRDFDQFGLEVVAPSR